MGYPGRCHANARGRALRSGVGPDQADYLNFGPLFFTYPACGSGNEHRNLTIWATGNVPLDFQDLELDNYVQLSEVIDCESGVGSPPSHVTGSWYDPARPGEGLAVQVLQDGRAIVQWMTYVSLAYGAGAHELDSLTAPLHINDAGIGCWNL